VIAEVIKAGPRQSYTVAIIAAPDGEPERATRRAFGVF